MDLSPKEADPSILRMFDHLFISISIAMAPILTSQVLRKTGPPSTGTKPLRKCGLIQTQQATKVPRCLRCPLLLGLCEESPEGSCINGKLEDAPSTGLKMFLYSYFLLFYLNIYQTIYRSNVHVNENNLKMFSLKEF